MPCELLANVEERLHLQADRAGLQINILCDNNTPAVLADSSRLEQVLVNLLHNSIKFTPEGGYIALQAKQDAENVVFSVKDTGIGIPAVDMNRIFERFYKIDRARRTGGTGLGLAIARHLVEAHGGQIWAESIEGQGSTFHFSIPIAR
jgi:two-component system phosphate regulon sensor histidine kinase PhoR